MMTRAALVSAVRVGVVVALLVMLVWATGSLSQLRFRINDVIHVPAPTRGDIVLVALDERSHQTYGRAVTDWSRAVFADLVRTVSASGARVLAFDVLYSEAARGDETFSAALRDARLTEARTRLIMPRVGVSPLSDQLTFGAALNPVETLAASADYLALVNAYPDSDQIMRRVPVVSSIEGETTFSFALAAWLAYLRLPAAAAASTVEIAPDQVTLLDHVIPRDEAGMMQPYFWGRAGTTFPVYSLAAVVEGEVPADAFRDRIVLVGLMNAVGVTDMYPTPNGDFMSGVEIHAHAIETLLQDAPVWTQPRPAQALTIIVCALGASLLYSVLRWPFMIAAAVTLTLGWFVGAFVGFSVGRVAVNLFDPALALVLPAVGHLGLKITTEARERRRAEFLLESVLAIERERLAIDRVLPRIEADVRRLLDAPSGAIYLPAGSMLDTLTPSSRLTAEVRGVGGTGEAHAFVFAHGWGDEMPDMLLRDRAVATRTIAAEGAQIAMPLVWQGQTLAVICVVRADRSAPSRATLALADSLAGQIAPSLDNVLLYERVQRQYERLSAILSSTPAGILILTPSQTVSECNSAATNLLKLASADALVGQPVTAVFGQAGADEETCARLSEWFSDGDEFNEQITLGESTFLLDAVVLPAGEWIVILGDVSPLAELNRVKTHVIRMAAHDLRNPLGLVMNFGALILMQSEMDPNVIAPKQKTQVETIVKAADNMLGIINDLLNLEQINAGAMTEQAPILLTKMVADVVELTQPSAETKRQTLTLRQEDRVTQVMGNARQLTQAITNLVTNAIKYTPDEGSIQVRVWREGEQMRIDVSDTGYGIAPEAQVRLFQPFYRVKSDATRSIAGTGLGLSLVKNVIDAHGGRVWVVSAEGEGSTFSLELPVYDPTPDDLYAADA